MRPKAIRTFELLYFGAIGLYLANSVRDYEALKLATGGDLTRRGLDPDTLLVISILSVVGMMLLLMFMVSRLRIGCPAGGGSGLYLPARVQPLVCRYRTGDVRR